MTTRDRKKYNGSLVWCVEDVRKGPIDFYVEVVDQQRVKIMFRESETTFVGFTISRRKARLLARRINQCLDATQ